MSQLGSVRSRRNSHHGYVNDEEHIHVSFRSHGKLCLDIETYVESGNLSAEEFYSPVRFRGQKRNQVMEQGIAAELRCFDLNPFDALGISQEADTVHFLLSLGSIVAE